MKLYLYPGEELFLTFKLARGSAWLTSHRLLMATHKPGLLDHGDLEYFFLKNLLKTEIKQDKLVGYFERKRKAIIQLPKPSPNLLEEIKQYIEKASQNHKKTK
jgi:hypothetical protein